jgi:hypothetical protein
MTHPILTFLNGDPLHDVSRLLLLPSVVKPGSTRLGVPGQILNVFERHPLRQEVSDCRHLETVRRQPLRQTGIFQPSLDQLTNPPAG